MRSTSRISMLGQRIRLHPAPLVTIAAFTAALYYFFYFPPGASAPASGSLSFFGLYAGSIRISGVSMEHEWVGLGLLATLPAFALMFGTARVWFLMFMATATFLFVSDYTSIVGPGAAFISGNLFTNTLGVEVSLVIGIFLSATVAATITTRRKS